MMAVTALSITISPLLLIVLDKWILAKLRAISSEQTTKRADRIEERNNVLLVGFGYFRIRLARFYVRMELSQQC